jgi:hypothetical protein
MRCTDVAARRALLAAGLGFAQIQWRHETAPAAALQTATLIRGASSAVVDGMRAFAVGRGATRGARGGQGSVIGPTRAIGGGVADGRVRPVVVRLRSRDAIALPVD